jgi:HEAT repeat protein
MAKARSSEAKLARLRQLRGAAASPQLLQELRGFLGDASHFVVAEAAELVGEAHWTDLAPDLAAAYERFLDNPVKKDKLCRAKIAVVDALNKLEFADEEFYLRGIRYVQLEPAWGKPIDAAVQIRVACAFGLVRIRYRGVLALLVDLLTDPEKGARAGAARALAYSGTEAAGLLLRLKARMGDAESEVVSECLNGMVELNPAEGVRFVAEFLSAPPAEVQEAALLALGSSRRPEAFKVLKAFAEKGHDELQEIAHLALALLRLPAATDYLLTLLAGESQAAASTALAALAVHRHDPGVRERVARAIAGRRDDALQSLFERRFGGDQGSGDG